MYVFMILSPPQIKVWYQNRRTKHKKDVQSYERRCDVTAESEATQNILRMLEHGSPVRATAEASLHRPRRGSFFSDGAPTSPPSQQGNTSISADCQGASRAHVHGTSTICTDRRFFGIGSSEHSHPWHDIDFRSQHFGPSGVPAGIPNMSNNLPQSHTLSEEHHQSGNIYRASTYNGDVVREDGVEGRPEMCDVPPTDTTVTRTDFSDDVLRQQSQTDILYAHQCLDDSLHHHIHHLHHIHHDQHPLGSKNIPTSPATADFRNAYISRWAAPQNSVDAVYENWRCYLTAHSSLMPAYPSQKDCPMQGPLQPVDSVMASGSLNHWQHPTLLNQQCLYPRPGGHYRTTVFSGRHDMTSSTDRSDHFDIPPSAFHPVRLHK